MSGGNWRADEMTRCGRAVVFLTLCIWAVGATTGASGQQAVGDLTIEHAMLRCHPQADCTKIKVYLKNRGDERLAISGVYLNERYLDCVTFQEISQDSALEVLSGAASDSIEHNTNVGALQWHRVLPNPIEPGCLGELTISLWGTVEKADVRIPLGEGSLTLSLRDEKPTLRLSHVAFDPADPNKIYVYCENETAKDIAIDHILVNAEQVAITKSIPTGNAIEAGRKSCFIVHPKQKMIWGKYTGVGVVGKGGEKAVAVLRVMNYFPIREWDGDTRPEMFLDATDMVERSLAPTETNPVAARELRPYSVMTDVQAMNGRKWEISAMKIIQAMADIRTNRPGLPCQINLANPASPLNGSGFFGDIADLTLMNLYRMRNGNIHGNASWLQTNRTWIDPRPAVAIQEAFRSAGVPKKHSWRRNLSPTEIRFSAWSVIAEGSKGVCYYKRMPTSPSAGYDTMPGAKWVVARTNLDLQLLRNYLRIGDTAHDLAKTDAEGIKCKTILCADKGLVLVLLNDAPSNVRWPTVWERRAPFEVSVSVPDGMSVAEVDVVDGGFHAQAFAVRGNDVVIPLDRITDVVICRLIFGVPTAKASARIAAPVKPMAASAVSVADCWRMYVERAVELCLPLRQGKVISDEDVTSLGRALCEARDRALGQLKALSDSANGLPSVERAAVRAKALNAYLRLGCIHADSNVVFTSLDDEADVLALANVLADCYVSHGLPEGAIEVLVSSAMRIKAPALHIQAARRIAELYSNKVGNMAAAIPWAKAMLEDASGAPCEAKLKVYLATLLLETGQPAEAAAILEQMKDPSLEEDVHYALGAAYCEMNKPEAALEQLDKCIQLNGPRSGEASYLIGLIHLARQEYAKAKDAFAATVRAGKACLRYEEAKAMQARLLDINTGGAL